MEKAKRFNPLGWYMIAGWGVVGPHYRTVIHRPPGWTDEEWDQFCHRIERDLYLESQEDWAYGPDPDAVEAYRGYWL